MMVNYRLVYFDKKARAEVCRMLFVVAGVPYEDVRISLDDWPKLKKDAPFAQLPVLEVDGRKLCQSLAIEIYLARKFGRTTI
ncbi:hypothetical protein LSH36_352g02000 [Paralvinella palmiformis]|uniref:GST N-terminal domain-containing protein n=1 Tax=Paralvinella palmiformis TaxID=53620 RepID=A0AAD9JFN1_9ANNE|nr:hypothetical protein LSH36_352g02000 [Paralvinella palmiformis]